MKKLPICPTNLTEEARKIWKRINQEYLLEPASLEILKVGLEAYDRMRQCKAVLDKEGLTTEDRFDQVRAHPLLATERDSRNAFLKSLKLLNVGWDSTPSR
jgi:P27 family predicted phage terminase small subunit